MDKSDTQEPTEGVAEHLAPEPPPPAEPQPGDAAADDETDSPDQPPGRSLRRPKKRAAGALREPRQASARRNSF